MADIGEKNYLMSGVAQENTSNEIKDLVQNIKPGDAKESSVQEVLNAVSNVTMESTSQEILDRIKKNMTGKAVKIAGSSNSVASSFATLKPALEITGSGELIWFGMMNRASGSGAVRQVRIEMDGVVIFDGTLNGTTSSNYDLYLNMGCTSVLMPVVGTSTFFPTPTAGTISIPSYGNIDVTLRPQLYNWTDRPIFCYIPFTDPIRFENSLKVYFKNTVNHHLTYSIGYTLD